MAKIETTSSWKTTWAGVAGALGVILIAVSAQFDGNTETSAEWSKVIDSAGFILAAFGIGAIGLNARDNDKSSESVGVK